MRFLILAVLLSVGACYAGDLKLSDGWTMGESVPGSFHCTDSSINLLRDLEKRVERLERMVPVPREYAFCLPVECIWCRTRSLASTVVIRSLLAAHLPLMLQEP